MTISPVALTLPVVRRTLQFVWHTHFARYNVGGSQVDGMCITTRCIVTTKVCGLRAVKCETHGKTVSTPVAIAGGQVRNIAAVI